LSRYFYTFQHKGREETTEDNGRAKQGSLVNKISSNNNEPLQHEQETQNSGQKTPNSLSNNSNKMLKQQSGSLGNDNTNNHLNRFNQSSMTLS